MKNLGVRREEGALVGAVTLVDKDGMRIGLNVTWLFVLFLYCFKDF